jgi:YD repeat-containing protein
MSGAAGPRWTTGSWGGDGGYVSFSYSSGQVSNVWHVGIMNPTPPDGTNTALQSGVTTASYTFGDDQFGYSSGVTTLRDWDGHGTNWYFDSTARVTQTQEWSGALWLLTYGTWDSNNNLTENVDARGYASDYAYDANGNTIAAALPSVSTNQGTFRPTSLYSYDRTNGANNIVAYCDPVRTHAISQDWTTNPGTSDSLCPNQSGATRYTWDYSDPTYEPFGRLSNSYTPLGYHRSYSYSTAAQGGDFGLPSDVNGDSMTQSDGTVRSPHQSFTYDGYGNLTTYSAAVGSTTLSYDGVNRPTAVTDPDSVTSRTCYYANGQVQAKQSASQYALDGNVACASHSVSYTYDPDGDVLAELHHFGNQAGTTSKYYDGADRLVEVAQPHDATADLYSYAWLTRYLYDLSQGSTVSDDGATFHAYGNLFKTQEYLPSNPVIAAQSTPASPTWMDVRGNSFDALDRATATYENAFGTNPKTTSTFDGNGNYGLLSQSQNAVGQQSIPSYLSTGWTYQKTYQNDGGVTPSETYTYDPDGRATAIQSSQFGAENLAYDSDGRVTSDAEPTGGGYSSPATLAYGYYEDGLRKSLSVSSSAVNASNAFQYSYRVDGLLQTQHITYPITGDFAFTYTNAGRELTQSDPYTGGVITLYTTQDIATSSTRTLQSKTFTYDSYGRVASLVLPEGYSYDSFTYDAEDETTAYARSNAYCPTSTAAQSCSGGNRGQTYSIRGELVVVGDSNPNSRSTQYSADGTLVTGENYTPESFDGFDARSGMILNKGGSQPYAYDAAGRQTQVTNTWPYGYTAYATRGYDAENHLISQAYTGTSFECTGTLQMCGAWPGATGTTGIVPNGVTNSYGWGPNGHPIQLTGNYTNTMGSSEAVSVHWDGDDILFGINQNGFLDFEVGKLGSANQVGEQYAQSFTVADRDMTGQAVSSHTWQDFGAWDSAPPGKQCAACSKGQASEGFVLPHSTPSDNDTYAPPITYLSGVREDGYNDGYGNTFQGVRAYDGNLGQWTSPDAYTGDVHDPMSQKPYMWNRNNPLGYSDPSGYYVCDNCTQGKDSQQQVVDDTMEAADKKNVAEMEKLDRRSPEYKRLAALHEDMQKGTRGWVLHVGTVPAGDDATTHIANNGIVGHAVQVTGGGPTTLGANFFSEDSKEEQSAVVTEGGLYEMANGRAGLRHEFGVSMYQDYVAPKCRGDKCDDRHGDNLTNRYFAKPIGVPPDI